MRNIRRFVTGHNANGKSDVIFAGNAANILDSPAWPGFRVTELWVTEEIPADNTGMIDRGARPIQHDPLPGGSIFRVVEIPPEASSKIDADALFAEMGNAKVPTAEDTAKHSTMHGTDSTDYVIIISGELHLILEESETRLQPGDCIIQRGTKHSWINRGEEPCIMAAVLIGAQPIPGM